MTFVIKDGLKDQLRDLVNSLGSAETIFLVRNQVLNVPLENEEALEKAQEWFGRTTEDPKKQLDEYRRFWWQRLEYDKVTLDIVSRLGHHVPLSKGDREELDTLEGNLREDQARFNQLTNTEGNDNTARLPRRTALEAMVTFQLQKEVSDFGARVFKYAEAVQAKR